MDDEISLQYPKWTAPLGEKKKRMKRKSKKRKAKQKDAKKSKNRENQKKSYVDRLEGGLRKNGSFFSFGKS